MASSRDGWVTGCPQGRERRDGTVRAEPMGVRKGDVAVVKNLSRPSLKSSFSPPPSDRGWSCNSATLKNIRRGCLKKHVPNLETQKN